MAKHIDKMVQAIDTMAQEDFNVFIEDFLKGDQIRKSYVITGSDKIEKKARKKAIECLIYGFEIVAENYFEKAKEFITNGNNKHFCDLGLRKRAYDSVLNRLTKHVQLLTDIIFPHNMYLKQAEQNRIEKIVHCILTRFPDASQNANNGISHLDRLAYRPLFIPLVTDEFNCVHFSYLPLNPVIIGMPLPALLSMSSQYQSVIWHEVGGHLVAINRANNNFKNWANELENDGVWSSIEGFYTKSVLQEFCNRKNIEDILNLLESEQWHEVWLGEFFEDLFGVQALGETMIEALAHALMRWYRDAALGDPEHPAPNLRLYVAQKFLEKYTRHYEENLCAPQNSFIDNASFTLFKFHQIENDENLKRAAERIADFYLKKVESGEFCKVTIDKDSERKAATYVCDDDKKFSLVNRISRKNLSFPDYQELYDFFSALCKRYKKLSEKLPFEILKDPNEHEKELDRLFFVLTRIKDSYSLKQLLEEVQFTEIDKLVGHGGPLPWPSGAVPPGVPGPVPPGVPGPVPPPSLPTSGGHEGPLPYWGPGHEGPLPYP